MITTIDKLKFGQKFRYVDSYDNETVMTFIMSTGKYHFFHSKNDTLYRKGVGCFPISRYYKNKLKKLIEESEFDYFTWGDSDIKVRILCVKNNKLNQKLYPNNEISKCKKYINL